MEIQCAGSFLLGEDRLPQLARLCASSFKLFPISTLKGLYMHHPYTQRPNWQDYIFFNRIWLELLHPFAAVKNLHLSEELVPRIAPTLQRLVGERTTEVTEVLRRLEIIFLEKFQPSELEPLHEGMEAFVAARQLISRPVAVSRWEWEEGEDHD
jgi:hypothetical protein